MRYYTDIEDFKNGVAELAKIHKDDKMMPVLLEVDGVKAPCLRRTTSAFTLREICLRFAEESTIGTTRIPLV